MQYKKIKDAATYIGNAMQSKQCRKLYGVIRSNVDVDMFVSANFLECKHKLVQAMQVKSEGDNCLSPKCSPMGRHGPQNQMFWGAYFAQPVFNLTIITIKN